MTSEPTRRTRGWRSESGAAVVEFAVVAFLLFLIVFGILDFGRAMNYWNNATQMANEGARWAAVNRNPGSTTGQTLQQYIRSQGDTSEMRDAAKVCVELPAGEAPPTGRAKVTVSMPFEFLPIIGLTTVTLSGNAEMRLEQVRSNYTEGCDP